MENTSNSYPSFDKIANYLTFYQITLIFNFTHKINTKKKYLPCNKCQKMINTNIIFY